MTKEARAQAQFQLTLKRLEKAYEDLKMNHVAFQELEKISFLKEIVKEQIRREGIQDENTNSSVC